MNTRNALAVVVFVLVALTGLPQSIDDPTLMKVMDCFTERNLTVATSPARVSFVFDMRLANKEQVIKTRESFSTTAVVVRNW
jgi:hypothetical protein